MGKFCGNCGSELKNDKCPKCDKVEVKKETKKVETKSEGSSFGWALLGFFVPIAGLILFLVFLNSKKNISKGAGIGALVRVGLAIITIIATIIYVPSFMRYFINYAECGAISSSRYACTKVIDYDLEDKDDDIEDKEDDEITEDEDVTTIYLKDIDTTKPFTKHEFTTDSLVPVEVNKEYDVSEQGFKLLLKDRQLMLIDDATGTNYDVVYNVDKAYYHKTECSGWDSIIAYSGNDVYYSNPKDYSYLNVKFNKLNYKYKSFVIVHNLTWTCGGSILTLGVQDTAKGDEVYYDLNTETIFSKDIYNFYKNNNEYIYTTRSFKFGSAAGEAKLVIKSSVVDDVYGVINRIDNAYAVSEAGTPLIGKVTKVTVKGDVTTLYLEDGTTKVFDYSEVEY